MKATIAIKPSEVKRDWIVVDAAGKRFGKVLTEVATLLRGKHKPYYTPNVDCGDFVIIINAKKEEFSGTKLQTKLYHRHTGDFGGVKTDKLVDLLNNNAAKLYRLAARGMLPKTNLAKDMIKKQKVYAGSEHPHTAQVSKAEVK